ncbi:exosome complex protein RRP42 [Acrasis kona]|uniref:Ribosomal RNA-processing protein 42 n=1 Tax=Acrasis kona TaxID=1008807 RepID=A0AAW2YTK8_9EUKA
MIKISPSEKQFLIDGIKQNMRTDGRSRLDYRAFTVETGLVAQTNGSARVKLANNTDVLVGVKVEIGDPDPDFPDQGRLEVRVECSPSASPEFEGRGAEEMNAILSAMLRNMLQNARTVDWASLCISPGKQCWIVYVDCLVLDSAGNLFDALSIATKSALFNTKVPKIEVMETSSGQTEIEVSDDPSDFTRLSTASIPISVTLAKVGSRYIVDPTIEEELCMESRVTIAINSKGNICSIQKGGVSSGINPSEFNKMLQHARKIGLVLLKELDALLDKEENNDTSTKIGFAR